jgi:hypothetical protein
MSETFVALRHLLRHIHVQLAAALSVRNVLGHLGRSLHLKVRRAPFSILIQNMGLLVFPAPYLGGDREGALNELIARINILSPDVVGICEIFANDERKLVRLALKDAYPFSREGPDESDKESDGGLLLLSKHQFLEAHDLIYRNCAGSDCWANKGVLHIRIEPPACPMPYANQNAPSIVMGDLNIPGEILQHYEEMLSRLSGFVDLWTVTPNPEEAGLTFVADNNFYEKDSDNPRANHRLDYILLKSGRHFLPIVTSIEVMRFERNARFISDHFGLRAKFGNIIQITP